MPTKFMVSFIGTKRVKYCVYICLCSGVVFKTAESWAKTLPVNIVKPQAVAATVYSKVLIPLF